MIKNKTCEAIIVSKILIIEDNDAIRNESAFLLADEGYQVLA